MKKNETALIGQPPASWAWIALFSAAVLFSIGCVKNLQNRPEGSLNIPNASMSVKVTGRITPDGLLSYKAGSHQLMMGYYRTWGDKVASGDASNPAMTDMPDSMDILSVFTNYTPESSPFWTQLKNTYVPALHAKGTKVIFTGGIAQVTNSADTAGINAWVNTVMAAIDNYGYDGYDIDIESTAAGETLNIQKACFAALSKYLGPKSGSGKLLIYDTNQKGNSLMAAIKDQVDYVLLQAYWRTANSLTATFNTYAGYISPSKFLVGVDFEDGSGATASYGTSGLPQLFDYAVWQPAQGTKGGIFSYGVDNEWYKDQNTYTRQAINIMNPKGGVVVFYGDAYYKGGASQAIPPGSYTQAQLSALGVSNDWASSVTVPAGWTVTMYADNNFSGASWTIAASTPWMGALSPDANDKVSSMVVQAPGVVFYGNGNYGGDATLPMPKGNYTLSQLQAFGLSDDSASSVSIPAGWTVTAYTDDNFSGTSWTLTASNPWLGALNPSANDVISSIKIQ